MREGYGNFYTDVVLIAKCKKLQEYIDLGSEVSKVKLKNLLEPLYMDIDRIDRKLVSISDKRGIEYFTYKNKRDNISRIFELVYVDSRVSLLTWHCIKTVCDLKGDNLKALLVLKLICKYSFNSDYEYMNRLVTACMLYSNMDEIGNDYNRMKRLVCNYNLSSLIANLLDGYTPRELLRVFPIQKYYEGYKWQVKDYFSSIEYVNEYGLDTEFTGDSGIDFIFNVQMDSFMSGIAVSFMTLASDYNGWTPNDVMNHIERLSKPKLEIVK
jgi:hypothetical protein